MNTVEASLKGEEQKYEDGLLFSVDFCNAVISCLAGKDGSEYNLKKGLSARAISRVVEAMNVMKSAAIAGEPVISVGSSATTYDHTAKIPEYLAVADVWERAGWIELVASGDSDERWQSVQEASATGVSSV